MNVTIIGRGQHAEARARVVDATPGFVLLEREPSASEPADLFAAADLPEAALERADVAFITAPTADHFQLAKAATKRGTHVFLEWPPATSIKECESIVRWAEEASVEVGVSRPLRFHPIFDALPDESRATLIVLRQEVDPNTPAFWPPRCADALDLCCALARSHSMQRIDAEAVPHHAAWPEAIAFGLRFHNGTYAQVSLYRSQRPTDDRLYVAGPDFQLEADWSSQEVYGRSTSSAESSLIEQETQRFLQALKDDTLPPVSVLDGLHTMRLVERLMEQLR